MGSNPADGNCRASPRLELAAVARPIERMEASMNDETKRRATTVAEELAIFATGVTFEALPSDVVRTVKRAIADAVACGIAGSVLPHSRAIQRYARASSPAGLAGV